jgi:serine/threonine protein kinase
MKLQCGKHKVKQFIGFTMEQGVSNLNQIMKLFHRNIGTHFINIILYELLYAVSYMHRYRIVHRDIKPQNILIGFDGHVRLADFSNSKILWLPMLDKKITTSKEESKEPIPMDTTEDKKGQPRNLDFSEHELSTGFMTTRWYLSPEGILNPYQDNLQMDVFALGCVFVHLLQHSPAFTSNDPHPIFISETNSLFHDGKEANICQKLFSCKTLRHILCDKVDKNAKTEHLRMMLDELPLLTQEDITELSSQKDIQSVLTEYTNKRKNEKKTSSSLFEKLKSYHFDPNMLDLLSQMLHLNPKKRITAYQAIYHPYFTSLRQIYPLSEQFTGMDIKEEHVESIFLNIPDFDVFSKLEQFRVNNRKDKY